MLFFAIALLILALVLCIRLRIVIVRQCAFREGLNHVSVFGNFFHIITWEPNEWVVIMHNKEIQPSTLQKGEKGSKRGGFKIISPFWGHEVFARIFLARAETVFDLNNLLSFDKIRVNLRVMICWKVMNIDTMIEEFCQSHSRAPEMRGKDIIDAAGDFLCIKAERVLRSLVSKKSVALPVLAKMNKSLEMLENKQTGIQVRFPFDANNPFDLDIDEILKINLEQTALKCGIKVEEIILEVSLPPDIHTAIEETWQSSLLPVSTVHEAIAREIDFRSMENLMGIDATTVNELLKNFQGASILGQLPFMDALMEKLFPGSGGKQENGTGVKILKKGEYTDRG